MAGVKKCSGGFLVLLFLLGSVPGVRADDAVLFDDAFFDPGDTMVVADPAEGDVPAAPPAAPPDQPAPPANQPPEQAAASPAGQPEAAPSGDSLDISLEPREIPETLPTGADPTAAGAAPQSVTPPAPESADPAATGTAPQSVTPAAPANPELPSADSVSGGTEPKAEPVQAAPPQESETAPAGEEIELVRTLALPPDDVLKQLRGEPTALADVLSGVNQPAERKRVTEAYWDVSEALALYHLSLFSAGDIEDCITRFTLRGAPSQSQTAVLVSARRLAEQRSAEAKVGLVQAQCRLAELRRQTGAQQQTVRLAIPSDVPNTLPYRTKFDRISREKRLAPQAAYYSEAIPACYERVTLYNKAAADALEAFRTLYLADGTSAEILLSAADKLNDAKERLIRSVNEYNKLIAAYVAETVGSDVQGDRLISTMIRLPGRSAIPAWENAAPARMASAVPIPTQYSPRRPRPVSAEIPPFDSSAAPNSDKVVRPDQNAEMLR